jgi:cob(I)alamin adenosyltransferase
MVRINRVYTRSGDNGTTGLVGGSRVSKDSSRIHTFGTLDEVNSLVGMTLTELASAPVAANASSEAGLAELTETLEWVQHKLFDVGAYLATPPGDFQKGMPSAGAGDVSRLEAAMDAWSDGLAELDSFLLPGGGKVGAWLHVCRTVCRRGEREVCRLHEQEPVDDAVMQFINRLSDFFFVAARHAAAVLGEPEVKWKPAAPDENAR